MQMINIPDSFQPPWLLIPLCNESVSRLLHLNGVPLGASCWVRPLANRPHVPWAVLEQISGWVEEVLTGLQDSPR